MESSEERVVLEIARRKHQVELPSIFLNWYAVFRHASLAQSLTLLASVENSSEAWDIFI